MDKESLLNIKSYLIVKIGDEEYGAHVNQVLSIMELKKITKIPKTPNYMLGVINLRGMVLPVIDTRIKLNLPTTDFTENTCIVVMDIKLDKDLIHIGALVDAVVAVYEIDNNSIEPTPSIGNKFKSEFITGVAKIEDNFIMILDLVKIFTNEEVDTINGIKKNY